MSGHLKALASIAVLACAPAVLLAQQQRFDDVIRNLRHPDPKVRLAAVQLLHESRTRRRLVRSRRW